MTKAELVSLFPNFSPKRALRKLDAGEEVPYEVVGKWVRVAKVGDGWDVFLCNMRDMTAGMGARRLNRLVALVPAGNHVDAVDGEAWWQTGEVGLCRSWLDENRVALGIAKRVETSDAVREARSSALKSVRKRRGEHKQDDPLLPHTPARVHEGFGPSERTSP